MDGKNFFKKQQKIYQTWETRSYFKANPNLAKTSYGLLMPPPNLTGELHLGHAMQHSILDAIARFKRMQGFDTLLLPGVDHAGIQFEGALNKQLAEEGLSRKDFGRDQWLKRAWQVKEEIYKSFHQTWTVMGISADWSKEVFTLEPKVQRAVFEQFKRFWEQGLLYKGAYIVQWCPKCGTAIEDVEMEYQAKKEKLYYVKYPIDGSNDYITIATARPETIWADTGIAIYPNHPKFGHFKGKSAINPLTGKKLPIFEDSRVDKKFGSGALKVTPGHDLLDFQIGQDHNLAILHAIDKGGQMTELTSLKGLTAQAARKKTVDILKEKLAIDKASDYTHSVPICERCKSVVEPLISKEWFIKMDPLAKKTLKYIDKVNFAPKNYLKLLSEWIKHLHNWSISRSLWWGHRIPVWYCHKCNPLHEVGPEKDMTISFKKPTKSCRSCRGKHWAQDEQVLDTWFSSGLWPLSTLGWPDETVELKKYYPWDFEISGPQIKYLWIARMILLGLWFRNEIPFKNMFFHGDIKDLQGRRFSKSLGNGIDPLELIKTWGADATRMALYGYSAPGRDVKTSRQIMDQRCQNFRNFSTKLNNIAKFIIELKPKQAATKLTFKHPDDRWIKHQLDQTIDSITKNLEEFKLHLATDQIYNFIWHEFADIYIEKSKNRRIEAQPVLEYSFKTSLELLHPFMPFITEWLWQRLFHQEGSIMLTNWPKKVRV